MYGADDPLGLVPFAEKVALCQQIDAAARARDPRVVQVSDDAGGEAGASSTSSAPTASSPPTCGRWCGSASRSSSSRTAGERSAITALGGRYLYDRCSRRRQWNRAIDEALRQALVNLDSVAAPAGEMPVVLGPGWPGVLLHEAVGHGLEGDFNRKGTSAFSGRIGERVARRASPSSTTARSERRRGSLTIDDEGTPTGRTVLIEDGILKGYLQDRLNARLMGMAPTGNGRRESFAHAPMPRMTNTFMLAGKDDPGELVERVKDGIYAKSFGGGQVDITSGKFVFTCTEAYRIRGGKIAEPIKGATLIGDGPTVLTRVKGIGNDLELDEGIGICGKAGQSVPAGVGQPTLLVDGLTVGGTAA